LRIDAGCGQSYVSGGGESVSENAWHPISTVVTLRRLTPADVDAVHTLLSNWTVVRYMLLPHCETREESQKCLDELISETPGGAWISVVRAIEVLDSTPLIGLCGIAILHGSEQGEIWYLVRPDRWGRGIAQLAAGQLLRIGFSELNLHRIFATCLPENPASSRVLEKIGMRKEGYQAKNLKIHNVWHDSHLYAILREEWQTAAGRAH
jgi:RimJ/RimL family protein N-acetyltransferase